MYYQSAPYFMVNFMDKTFFKTIFIQPFLNCGYMNTCFKCGQKFLCKGHKDQFSTFETCIHITAFKTLLYVAKILRHIVNVLAMCRRCLNHSTKFWEKWEKLITFYKMVQSQNIFEGLSIRDLETIAQVFENLTAHIRF